VVGSPGRGATSPKVFGRDGGWNVSIRRRRRHEGRDEDTLAEQAIEEIPHLVPLPTLGEAVDAAIAEQGAILGSFNSQRTPSVRSSLSRNSSSAVPKALTGEVSPITPFEPRYADHLADPYRSSTLLERSRRGYCPFLRMDPYRCKTLS